MNPLGQSIRLRLAASLVLLALHPNLVILSAEFLSSQSGDQARVEYIDDDVAINQSVLGRKSWLSGAIRSILSSPAAVAALAGTHFRPLLRPWPGAAWVASLRASNLFESFSRTIIPRPPPA